MIKQIILAALAVTALGVSAAATAQDRQDAVSDHAAVHQGQERVLDDRRDLHTDTAAERNDIHDVRDDHHLEHQAALDRAHHRRLVHHHQRVTHRTHDDG